MFTTNVVPPEPIVNFIIPVANAPFCLVNPQPSAWLSKSFPFAKDKNPHDSADGITVGAAGTEQGQLYLTVTAKTDTAAGYITVTMTTADSGGETLSSTVTVE